MVRIITIQPACKYNIIVGESPTAASQRPCRITRFLGVPNNKRCTHKEQSRFKMDKQYITICFCESGFSGIW